VESLFFAYLLPILDMKNKLAALKHTRGKYEESRSITDTQQIEKLLHAAQEAQGYIEKFLVQGVRKDGSAFSTTP
jgi:hypothetical protein